MPPTAPTPSSRDAVRRLVIGDLEVEVTVRRVRRMNLGVHPPDGRIRLSVPARTSDRAMRRFVRESRAWIDRHRRRIASEERAMASRPRPPVLLGADGEMWPHLGQSHRLVVVAGLGRPQVTLLQRELRSEGECDPGPRLQVRVPEPADRAAVLRALDRWQRSELRSAAEPLLAHWCERVEVSYGFLGLRRMSTRWGSCVPARGRIWLNVALLDHPLDLLEYVVVHEVVHLREASHGPRFRALMDRHLPDWHERRRRLDATTSPLTAVSSPRTTLG